MVKKGDKEMNKVRMITEIIMEYFESESIGTIPKMKNYAERKLDESINGNTFYTIIRKMKMNGNIDCTDKRGEYIKGRKQADKGKQESCSGEEKTETSDEAPEMGRSVQEGNEAITAEEFIRRAISGLRMKTKYNTLLKNDTSIDPWSITPEYAQCIASIKKIVEEFEKIDAILEKDN